MELFIPTSSCVFLVMHCDVFTKTGWYSFFSHGNGEEFQSALLKRKTMNHEFFCGNFSLFHDNEAEI